MKSNKLEIQYPSKKDLLLSSQFEEPLLFNHFSYFGIQIVIVKVKTKFRVLTMNYITKGLNTIDYTKEWQIYFESSDYYATVFKFQSLVKKVIVEQNHCYLEKVYKMVDSTPEEVLMIKELFE